MSAISTVQAGPQRVRGDKRGACTGRRGNVSARGAAAATQNSREAYGTKKERAPRGSTSRGP